MHTYSPFWLAWAAGLITLSSAWHERSLAEEQVIHPAEHMSMNEWLRMSNRNQARIIHEYSRRTPKLSRSAG